VVLDQVELRVDRSVEKVSKRLGKRLSFLRGWRLSGVSATLRIHRQGFFVGDWFNELSTGEEPLVC
jgi:hypothetical protein